MSLPLTDSEKQILLQLAREAVECGVTGRILPILDQNSLSPNLIEYGSSFVTLTIHTELRGCIGSLEAHQPLVDDVREHAIAAALQDPRFPPVQPAELGSIHLEISRLTTPQALEYSSSDDLIKKLKPHVDGVILQNGHRRATFLPQVWEKLPDPVQFLEHLCQKMGMDASAWRHIPMQVFVYQAEDFGEEN
jgi:AmmeMemoRadiSam system protein A